jgi:hypothetical protein
MARTVTVTKVPNAEVAQAKAGYEHEGATVTVTPDGTDTSTIVAVWADAAGADGTASVAAQAHAAAAQAHASAASAHASAAAALASAASAKSAKAAKGK